MLKDIFGNNNAVYALLHVYHHGEIHATAIANDLEVALSPIQNQLDRFERAGVLVSKKVGKTRVYFFNMKSPIIKPFIELIKIYYESLPFSDHQKLFPTRRRPRVKGKPVFGRKGA
ncbi:MAG: winged helix-turn-helix transcriptional regulator [Oligoflexia bacterium]|nr:winged helix-turn-helix transcriptional regulator [Oligoflexia bacterium]